MNLKITFSFLSFLVAAMATAQNVTNGLVAAYSFNPSSTDSLRNSVTTTQVGTFAPNVLAPEPNPVTMTDVMVSKSRKPTKTKGRNNEINGAFSFTEMNYSHVFNPSPSIYNGSTAIELPFTGLANNQYTYSLWMKTGAYSSYWGILLAVGGHGGDQVIALDEDGIRIHCYYQGEFGTTTVAVESSLPAFNVWTHIVSVRSADKLSLYINGQLKNEMPIEGSTNIYGMERAKLGCRYNDVNGYTGEMDDVKLYNRALTAAEVLQEYNASIVTGITDPGKEDLFIEMYPNPVQNTLHVELSEINEPLEYAKIIDLNGTEVVLLNPSLGEEKLKINTENLKKGYYLLQLKTTKHLYTRRFIK